MRWSLSLMSGPGEGLGNEVIPWAKSWIAARELGLRTLHPGWGRNPRQYWRDFGTARADWIVHRLAARAMPRLHVPADVYELTGTAHYGDAIRRYLGDLPAGPLLVTHEGMSGGYLGIEAARDFVRAELLRPPHVAADLYRIGRAVSGDRLVVALHVRRGDFGATPPGPGQFNAALPMSWYRGITKQIEGAFPGRVTTLVLSDDPGSADEVGSTAIALPARAKPLLSDVLTLAEADLLVCSVSSFSMLGAFLSNAPYIWYRPQLVEEDGWLSIWGDEPGYGHAATARSRQRAAERRSRGRGIPLDVDEPLPDDLLRDLEARLRQRDSSADLLRFGVLPARSPSS